MSREIKFRAWVKSKKYMRVIGEIYCLFFEKSDFYKWEKSDAVLVKKDWRKPQNCFPYSDLEIMQYTGLKDKNWVEIYEGDLLEVDDESRRMFDAAWSDGSGVRKYVEVWYQNGGFMVRRNVEEDYPFDRKFDSYLWLFSENSSLAWNIYQNPDLLWLNSSKT